jgi:hypothetical protein
VTPERVHFETLPAAIFYLLFPRSWQAFPPADLDILYQRFISIPDTAYHRAYWESLRRIIPKALASTRTAIIRQITRTPWDRLCAEVDPTPLVFILNECVVDPMKQQQGVANEFEVEEGLVAAFKYILREFYERDIEDTGFRVTIYQLMARLFQRYPPTGEERTRLAETTFLQASTGPEFSRGGDLLVLKALISAEADDTITGWSREQTMSRLCRARPPLPDLILSELAAWKGRQQGGLENMMRLAQVDFRIQFLLDVLTLDKAAGGGFTFTHETLTGFWKTAMVRTAGGDDGMVVGGRFWGGDLVTDSMRLAFLRTISQRPFHLYSGLVLSPFSPPFVRRWY